MFFQDSFQLHPLPHRPTRYISDLNAPSFQLIPYPVSLSEIFCLFGSATLHHQFSDFIIRLTLVTDKIDIP